MQAEASNDAIPDRMFMYTICGWLYDEARGLPHDEIPPGTRWENVPDGFVCSECGADADWFQELRLGG